MRIDAWDTRLDKINITINKEELNTIYHCLFVTQGFCSNSDRTEEVIYDLKEYIDKNTTTKKVGA